MNSAKIPTFDMVTLEMEEQWEKIEDFLLQWEQQHPEYRNLPPIERLKLQNLALKEAGLE